MKDTFKTKLESLKKEELYEFSLTLKDEDIKQLFNILNEKVKKK